MTLFVSSIFRDSASYIDRYVSQLDSLAAMIRPTPMHVIVAEGDSVDDTPHLLRKALNDSQFETTLLTVNHGGPRYASIDNLDRWQRIALVCNKVLDRVSLECLSSDQWLYVESDLIWQAHDMVKLLDGLDTYPAVAAMSMMPGLHYFYDTWGHRKDGIRFTREPPYHPSMNGQRYVEIDSAGSCFAMRGECVGHVKFGDDDCVLGIGRSLRENQASLYLDREVSVTHP